MWSARIQLAASVLLLTQHSIAGPISPASLPEFDNATFILQERSCVAPSSVCGYYGQACCAVGEYCYTDSSNDEASCAASSATMTAAPTTGAGSWVYWTSTFVETNLVTYYSTYSSYVGVVPAATTPVPAQSTANAVVCTDSGQTSCGNICCASWQYCLVQGQCAAKASSVWTPTTSYESYTAPLRPTSVGTQITTSTISPTTTVGFEPAVQTGSNVTISSTTNSGGLSGGAIAGIVIGVILGLILLILLCLCICAGEVLAGILRFFGCGGGRRKETRRTEEVEYYNRHDSRADGRTWYGSGRKEKKKKKKNGGIGWLTLLAGGLAAFWATTTFASKRKRNDEKSSTATYSSYDSQSYTASSARRTEDSRRAPSRRP